MLVCQLALMFASSWGIGVMIRECGSVWGCLWCLPLEDMPSIWLGLAELMACVFAFREHHHFVELGGN